MTIDNCFSTLNTTSSNLALKYTLITIGVLTFAFLAFVSLFGDFLYSKFKKASRNNPIFVYSRRNNNLQQNIAQPNTNTNTTHIASVSRQFNRTESAFSYENALKNSSILVQENISSRTDFKLPTYDEYIKSNSTNT